MEALNAREQGKVLMYKQDAWGHVETRFRAPAECESLGSQRLYVGRPAPAVGLFLQKSRPDASGRLFF